MKATMRKALETIMSNAENSMRNKDCHRNAVDESMLIVKDDFDLLLNANLKEATGCITISDTDK
jgi:hypothetical protein